VEEVAIPVEYQRSLATIRINSAERITSSAMPNPERLCVCGNRFARQHNFSTSSTLPIQLLCLVARRPQLLVSRRL
jgi:hypothetical protein